MASRSSSPEASPAKQKSNLAAVRLDTELSAQEYLDRHSILLYLHDVVALLLQARTDRPIEFIADYFSSVITGTHVVLRNFDYINACEHNRWAFVTSCIGAFAELPHDDLMDALELTQMIRLLCPDFPVQLVEHVFLLCGGEADAHPFRKVLEATLMWFYYNEFFERIAEVFSTCDTRSTGFVNRNVLLLTLRQMCRRLTFAIPPPYIFDDVLDNADDEQSDLHADIRLLEMQSALLQSPAMYEKLACNGDPLCGSLLASPSRARPRPADALNRADDGRETGATPAEMPSKPARKSASAVRQQSIKRVAAAATTKR